MAAPVLESVTTIVDQLANGNSVSAKVSMRYETLRLCTFLNYPDNKPFRIKLAKAGFYYASNSDEVICYCCAKRIRNWRDSDDPMNEHRFMSPNCSYLVRNSEVNVRVTSKSYTGDGRLDRILASLENDAKKATENRPPVISSERRSQLHDSIPGRRPHPIQQLFLDVASGINLDLETEEDPSQTSFRVEEPGHPANLMENGAASSHRNLAAAAISNDPSSSVEKIRQSTDVKPRYHQTRKNETGTKHASKDILSDRASGQTFLNELPTHPTEIISHAAASSLNNGLQTIEKHENIALRSAQHNTSINGFSLPAKQKDNRNVIFRSSCGANRQRIADDAVSDNVDPHNPIADVISYRSQLGKESQSYPSMPIDTGTGPKNPEKIRLKEEKRRLESENQSLKEEITCKQCHEHEIEMVFLPCGHVITCESCGTKARICFSCKQVIKGIAKFYSA